MPGDFGDATLAAMTNLETDNKIGNEREEEEEEVYGIFTGNEILICFSFGQIFFHSSDRGCLCPFVPLESHLNWGQMLYFHFSLLFKSKIQERKKTRFKSKSSGSLHK